MMQSKLPSADAIWQWMLQSVIRHPAADPEIE